MTEKLNKEGKKEDSKDITNEERIKQLRLQQEQVRETYIKIQGAIEMLEALDEEAK